MKIHYYSHRFVMPADLLCPLCKNAVEDDLHFILCCQFYSGLRQDLIPEKFFRHPNAFRLCLLLASTNENIVRKLCVCVYKALKAREIAIA